MHRSEKMPELREFTYDADAGGHGTSACWSDPSDVSGGIGCGCVRHDVIADGRAFGGQLRRDRTRIPV